MRLTGLRLVVVAAALVLSACANSGTAPVASTPTLIPAVVTATYTPLPPTMTSPALPGPADVSAATPATTSVSIPAAAQSLISRALDDLTQQLNISRDTIQIHQVESATWASLDLGCGEVTPSGDAALAISGYRVVFQVADTLYEYHTDDRSTIRRCEQAGTVVGETESLLAADPIASELAMLAQRRLGTTLDLPTLRIAVVSVDPYIWTDTSLGCPQPGESYTPLDIDGYRIVLNARDQEYIFHTDFDRVIPCDADHEQLPASP